MRLSIAIFTAALLSIWTLAQAGDEKAAEVATATEKSDKASGGDCLFSRTISSWNVVDDETLIIYAPTRKSPYLVKLWGPVFSLKSEFTLGIEDRDNDGRFCDYGRDAIIVRDPGGPERYNVRTVQRLDEAEAQALIEGAKEKKEKKKEPAVKMPEQSDVKSDKQN